MSDDYDDILDRQWDEIPEEKLLPDGKYLLRVRNAAFVPPKGDANGKVLVFFNVQEVLDVDDPSAFEALGDDYDITQNEVTYTVWVERNRDWKRVKALFEQMGADTSGGIQDTFKKLAGCQIAADLRSRSFDRKDGTSGEENTAIAFYAVE